MKEYKLKLTMFGRLYNLKVKADNAPHALEKAKQWVMSEIKLEIKEQENEPEPNKTNPSYQESDWNLNDLFQSFNLNRK